jgi:hypothetical protein
MDKNIFLHARGHSDKNGAQMRLWHDEDAKEAGEAAASLV